MDKEENELREVLVVPYIDEVESREPNNLAPDNSTYEYLRSEAYKSLLGWFSEYGSEDSLRLWLWSSYLVRGAQKKSSKQDPVFFFLGDFPYPDVFLQFNEKRLKRLKKKVEVIAEELKNVDTDKEEKLTVETGEKEVILKRGDHRPIRILRTIYDRFEGISNRHIEKMLLRYQNAGIRMIPLPNEYYSELEKKYGVEHHVYSTPFDNYYKSFGSSYGDTDAPFGSLGDIFRDDDSLEILKEGGNFELNCIHLLQYHNVVINHLVQKVLKSKKREVTIFIVYDSSLNEIDYSNLKGMYVWSSKLSNNRNFLVLKSRGAPPLASDQLESLIRTLGIRKAKTNITHPILTVYEKAKILGTRAMHLAKGAPMALTDVPEGITDLITIAEMELEAKVLPILLERPMPNGELEEWDPNQMFDPSSGSYKRFTTSELHGKKAELGYPEIKLENLYV